MVSTTYVSGSKGGVLSLPETAYVYVDTEGSVATVGGDFPSLSLICGASSIVSIGLLSEGASYDEPDPQELSLKLSWSCQYS